MDRWSNFITRVTVDTYCMCEILLGLYMSSIKLYKLGRWSSGAAVRNTKNALPGQACRLRRRHLSSSRRSQGRGCSWLKSYATRRLEILLSGKRRCSSAISCSLPGFDGASFNASDLARAAPASSPLPRAERASPLPIHASG